MLLRTNGVIVEQVCQVLLFLIWEELFKLGSQSIITSLTWIKADFFPFWIAAIIYRRRPYRLLELFSMAYSLICSPLRPIQNLCLEECASKSMCCHRYAQ